MVRLEKLMIRGIRSYNPNNLNTIEFASPLTLIVGQNGSGKTTIIESLKFITTNDLPQNSRGGAFIYDPKLLQQTDVKAQVKLKFVNINNIEMVCTRSIQATQRKNALTQKTIDSTLLFKNEKEQVSVSNRCVNLDNEMQYHLGVSSAILQNVIFCHQEESNWILSEPANVKKRLDDIFATSKYSKALESIKSTKKEATANLKLKNQELDFLYDKKMKKEKLEMQNNELYDKLNRIDCEIEETKYNDIENEIRVVKNKLSIAQESENKKVKLIAEIEILKRNKHEELSTNEIENLVQFLQQVKKQDDNNSFLDFLSVIEEKQNNANLAQRNEKENNEQTVTNKNNDHNIKYKQINIANGEKQNMLDSMQNSTVINKPEHLRYKDIYKMSEKITDADYAYYTEQLINEINENTNKAKEIDEEIKMVNNCKHEIQIKNNNKLQSENMLKNIEKREQDIYNNFKRESTDIRVDTLNKNHISTQVNTQIYETMNVNDTSINFNDILEETYNKYVEQKNNMLVDYESKIANIDQACAEIIGKNDKLITKNNENNAKMISLQYKIDDIEAKQLEFNNFEATDIFDKELELAEKESELNEAYKNQDMYYTYKSKIKDKQDYYKQIKENVKHICELYNKILEKNDKKHMQHTLKSVECNTNYKETYPNTNKLSTCDDIKRLCNMLKSIYQDKEQEKQKLFAKYQFLVGCLEQEIQNLKTKTNVETLYDLFDTQKNDKHDAINEKIEGIQKSIALADNAFLLYQSFLKKGRENEMCYVCKKRFSGNDKENYCTLLTNITNQIPKTIESKKLMLIDLKKEYENEVINEAKNKEINDTKQKIKSLIQEIEKCKENSQSMHNNKKQLTSDEHNTVEPKKYKYDVDSQNKTECKINLNEIHKYNTKAIKITDYINELKKYEINNKYVELIALTESVKRKINDFEKLHELFYSIKTETVKVGRKPEIISQEIKNIRNEIEKNKRYQNIIDTIYDGKKMVNIETMKTELISEKEKIKENVLELQKNIENNEHEIKKLKTEISDLKNEKCKHAIKLENYKNNCARIKNEMKEIESEKVNIQQRIKTTENEMKMIYENLENDSIMRKTVHLHDLEKSATQTAYENNIEKFILCDKLLLEELKETNVKIAKLRDNYNKNVKYIQDIKNIQKIYKEDIIISDLYEELSKHNKNDLEQIIYELKNYEKILNEKLYKKAMLEGEKKQIEKSITNNLIQLKEDYDEIVNKYTNCYIEIKTLDVVIEDIDKCIKALDRSIVDFHASKIEEVNTILKELWFNTYKGNDIDYIKLKSETCDNKVYNYKVVMYKNNVELELRGRCSAGQKVLASILMRLALSDAFTKDCSVMALDEPTTNLDKENIEALAYTLKSIISKRRKNQNFQLILITHDENFVEIMCRDECDHYYQIKRNENGDSEIYKQTVL
ncbi:DNA repair protein rad50 [Binucleata daphniae]